MKMSQHKYLLYLYSQVNSYLVHDQQHSSENFADKVVSFCIVVEKILKIKLHKKNPVLVFGNSKIKDNDALVAIVSKKEKNIETIKIYEAVSRFESVFKKIFSDDELQALEDVYSIRSQFIHGYKPDDQIEFNEEDIIKKMGTIWEKISKQAIKLFGSDIIKKGTPRKKYTEEELERVLEEEVRVKIKSTRTELDYLPASYLNEVDNAKDHCFMDCSVEKKCPRCESYGFSIENSGRDGVYSSTISFSSLYPTIPSDLYKCKKCGLELTRKEYEIAKCIKSSQYKHI